MALAAAPQGMAQLTTAAPPAPSRSRNTLVARTDRATGTVSAECEEGLSPAPALRVDVAEIPVPEVEPASVEAPPSAGLRGALQDTQNALLRNDRPAFDEALADAKTLLRDYPTGAERRAAEEIVRLHEAAARLWDTQYQSPFFGEDDPLYTTVSAFPGYGEAVRRSVLTDQRGRRFYPVAESRDFLARVIGERLQRIGIRSTTRVARNETRAPRVIEEQPVTTSRPRASSSTPSRSTSTTSRSSTPARSSSRPSTTTARSSTPTRPRATSVTRSASPTPEPSKPAPVLHASGQPNPSAPPTTAAEPAPVPAAVPPQNQGTPPAPDAGDVATATTSTTAAPSTTLAETALSTDVIPATPKPASTRSVILPTILILIGLGVLIVLFRASK